MVGTDISLRRLSSPGCVLIQVEAALLAHEDELQRKQQADPGMLGSSDVTSPEFGATVETQSCANRAAEMVLAVESSCDLAAFPAMGKLSGSRGVSKPRGLVPQCTCQDELAVNCTSDRRRSSLMPHKISH